MQTGLRLSVTQHVIADLGCKDKKGGTCRNSGCLDNEMSVLHPGTLCLSASIPCCVPDTVGMYSIMQYYASSFYVANIILR